MRKVASEHPFCVLVYMNSYIFHIYFILFIFLSNTYLIFDFRCLALSSADTHEIAKCSRTYIRRYTHTHTHTQKLERVKKKGRGERGEKKRSRGSGKRKKKGKGQKENEEKKEKKREKKGKVGGGQKKKRKREGDGFRGLEERGY